eukprot:260815_1
MSAFSSLALTISTITTIIVAIDIPISCTRTVGTDGSGIGTLSTATCASASDTMVSCGHSGNDKPLGTYMTNQCASGDSGNRTAQAHCCTFPPDANITTTTILTMSAGASTSVQCPTGSQLTGCSVGLYSTPTMTNFILGTSVTPMNVAWTDTDNTCTAATGDAGNGLYAQARCVTINNPSYALECQTKAAYTNHANFGSCDSGYDMMSCHAYSEGGALHAWYVTNNNTCYVQKDNDALLWANAICCKLTLTTSSPTTVPTQTPTQSPTRHPTHPTDVPTQSPTRPMFQLNHPHDTQRMFQLNHPRDTQQMSQLNHPRDPQRMFQLNHPRDTQ